MTTRQQCINHGAAFNEQCPGCQWSDGYNTAVITRRDWQVISFLRQAADASRAKGKTERALAFDDAATAIAAGEHDNIEVPWPSLSQDEEPDLFCSTGCDQSCGHIGPCDWDMATES